MSELFSVQSMLPGTWLFERAFHPHLSGRLAFERSRATYICLSGAGGRWAQQATLGEHVWVDLRCMVIFQTKRAFLPMERHIRTVLVKLEMEGAVRRKVRMLVHRPTEEQ